MSEADEFRARTASSSCSSTSSRAGGSTSAPTNGRHSIAASGSGCRTRASIVIRAIRTTSKRTRAEFTELFNTILINVTAFFRDAQMWEYIASDVIPRILQLRQGDASIRVWSAGCSSGEEAYSLAMLLAEALGPDRFNERVKVYATDVDEEALNQGRAAAYDRQGRRCDPEAAAEQIFRARRSTAGFSIGSSGGR